MMTMNYLFAVDDSRLFSAMEARSSDKDSGFDGVGESPSCFDFCRVPVAVLSSPLWVVSHSGKSSDSSGVSFGPFSMPSSCLFSMSFFVLSLYLFCSFRVVLEPFTAYTTDRFGITLCPVFASPVRTLLAPVIESVFRVRSFAERSMVAASSAGFRGTLVFASHLCASVSGVQMGAGSESSTLRPAQALYHKKARS